MCDLNDNWSKSLENSLEFLLGFLGTCPSSWGKIVDLSGPSLQIFGIVLPFHRETNWLKEIHTVFRLYRPEAPVSVRDLILSSSMWQEQLSQLEIKTCYIHSCQESPCCGNVVNSFWAMRWLDSQYRAILTKAVCPSARRGTLEQVFLVRKQLQIEAWQTKLQAMGSLSFKANCF